MRNQHATPHNQAAKLNADERRLRTIELRKAGLSLRQIAGQTGVSVVTAKKDLDRALADLLAEQNARTEELRALELERLDKMFMSLWMKAYDDRGRAIDYGAIDRLLRIAERRAKLLGLDMPVRSIMELDWRKELEAAGVKASDVFEQLVNQIAEHIGGE